MEWKKIVTREMPLTSIWYVKEGYLKGMWKEFDCGFKNSLFISKKGIVGSYRENRDLKKFNGCLRNIAKKDKIKEYLDKGIKINQQLIKFLNDFKIINITKLTNQELLKLFSEFNNLYIKYWSLYMFAYYIGPALEGTNLIGSLNKFKEELKELRGSPIKDRIEELFYKKNFSEIAQRAEIKNSGLLFYTFPKEIIDFLKENKEIIENELKKRFENYVLVIKEGKEEFYIGDKTKKIEERELIKETEDYSKITEIKGTPASHGYARGKVKVLMSSKDISKVKHGDILVTPMTNPNYVPAMEKANAFVTDEGGITCHAAIVAREMGKPCIIGTKIATKIFKNGDLVEVDAEKGIVKKIITPE